jgi:hypothetical protein
MKQRRRQVECAPAAEPTNCDILIPQNVLKDCDILMFRIYIVPIVYMCVVCAPLPS